MIECPGFGALLNTNLPPVFHPPKQYFDYLESRRQDSKLGGAELSPLQKRKLELQDKLNRIMFPKIEFKDAHMSDVIKVLGDSGVNIVLAKTCPRPEDSPKITLSLRNVSLRDALRYATDIAGLKIIVDSDKIMIVPCDYGKSHKPD